MVVNGREVRFFRSVQANCMVCDAAPGGDAERFFRENITDVSNYSNSQHACAVLIEALSFGYEYAEKAKDPAYIPHPITQEEALTLSSADFLKLFVEAYQAWLDDGKVTVETEAPKGKKTAKAEKSA